MRITTWNVNSVRLRGELIAKLAAAQAPDILCLQEIKVETAKFPHELFDGMGYEHRFIHGQKGYHGVAVLSKIPLDGMRSRFACGNEEHRHAIVSLPGGIELHNLYIPAGGDVPDPSANSKFKQKLDMLEELQGFYAAQACERMILVGDFNIAPAETDVWSHKQLLKVVSHTPIEVENYHQWQRSGQFADAVRTIIPMDEKIYSWWSYRARDWSKSDRGRRLDHVWCGTELAGKVKGAHILKEARGWPSPSDHVPVSVDFAI